MMDRFRVEQPELELRPHDATLVVRGPAAPSGAAARPFRC